MKKLILAAAVSLIVGCSSKPAGVATDTSVELDPEVVSKIAKINFNGVLIHKDGIYSIGDKLLPLEKRNGFMTGELYLFNARTLFPAFDSTRFKCSMKEGKCNSYFESEKTSPFVRVNTNSHSYGDTYEERIAKGEKPGLTAGEVFTYAAGGVFMAPALAVATVISAPFQAIAVTSNLIQYGSVSQSKYVEFDHDKFYEVLKSELIKNHGSIENYINFMAEVSKLKAEVDKETETMINNTVEESKKLISVLKKDFYYDFSEELQRCEYHVSYYPDFEMVKSELVEKLISCQKKENSRYLASINDVHKQLIVNLRNEQLEFLNSAKTIDDYMKFIREYEHYASSELIAEAQEKLRALTLKEQKLAFDKINSIQSGRTFIGRFKDNDPAGLVPKVVERVRSMVSNEQHKAFNSMKTAKDAHKFIDNYEGFDPANLVGKVVARIPDLERNEQITTFENAKTINDLRTFISIYRDQDKFGIIRKAKLKLNNLVDSDLERFRKSLKVGDATFCGRIIDKRDNMFEIAVSAPLPGYASTAWVHTSDVYKAESGCRNVNGVLSPRYNPYDFS